MESTGVVGSRRFKTSFLAPRLLRKKTHLLPRQLGVSPGLFIALRSGFRGQIGILMVFFVFFALNSGHTVSGS